MSSSISPQKTAFINSSGQIGVYYIQDNPWKVIPNSPTNKIFRYCIICGRNRFPDDTWTKVLDLGHKIRSFTACNQDTCREKVQIMPGFVPEKHYYVLTDQDRNTAEGNQDHFESIAAVTTYIRFDTVYFRKSDIPKEYFDILNSFENIPIETRIEAIDTWYFQYAQSNAIELGADMKSTQDPLLKEVAKYRERCVEILHECNRRVWGS